MQRQSTNEFDHATLEAMMERYRAELLRYQRATPPGKPTLSENLNEITKDKEAQPKKEPPKLDVQPQQVLPSLDLKQDTLPEPIQKIQQPNNVTDSEIKQEKNDRSVGNQPITAPQDLPLIPNPEHEKDSVTNKKLELQPKELTQNIEDTKPELKPEANVTQPQVVQEKENIADEQVLTKQLSINNYFKNNLKSEKPNSESKTERELSTVLDRPILPYNKKTEKPLPIKSSDDCRCCGHTEFEKCVGAYGTFRPYERMGKYTTASFLQTPGEATSVLVRFAADVPVGSADAIRCRRSFSVKFYCNEGEYDLFGMHLPVSVGTTKKTLSDCCAASRADPKTGLRSRSSFWEFLVTHTEALHATMWLYSDLGTIGSYRTIDGYSMPCIWVNSKGENRVVRPHWLSRQRPQTLTRFEAEELAGADPDAVARDLIETIKEGDRPQYELCIQVIEPSEISELSFDPFDPTAIWPAELFKPQRIGLLTLERLPDHIENELLSTRFEEGHIIPGIEYPPSPGLKNGEDFTQVKRYLRSLGEYSRHRLIDNLKEELIRLPPLLLEQVLILFSRADLEFGQAMTLALGG